MASVRYFRTLGAGPSVCRTVRRRSRSGARRACSAKRPTASTRWSRPSIACAGLFGFKRVEVPLIEPTAVFARTIGETTDVVSKEMYSFEDRCGRFDHAAARIHRRHLPRLSERGLAAICAAEGRDPWRRLPLRTAAEGPLPPVPPARRRDHRRRRAAGRCRDAGLRRPVARRTRHRTASRSSSTRLAMRTAATPGASALVEHFAAHRAELSRGQPRAARARIRCASSTARTRATGRCVDTRRRSMNA